MEPKILTANTFYWRPGSSANQRRNNEKCKLKEVKEFLESLGFETTEDSENVHGKKDNIEVHFHYSESCRNVYKRFKVFKDGKKSNIKTLRKLVLSGSLEKSEQTGSAARR